MTQAVAVVTGGFGILGAAVAKAADNAGYRVALVDFAKAPAESSDEVGLSLGGVDLADPAAAEAAVKTVIEKLGRIDVLFNVAGGFIWQTVAEGDPAAWDRLQRINLTTTLNASRAALPYLLANGAGRIVNVGANAAMRADAGMGAYAASKAGVHRLTESMAAELRGTGVTVNAVLPSILDTPANRSDMPDAAFDKWVAPADLAAVMVFLASLQAGAVTGALVPVTGGL